MCTCISLFALSCDTRDPEPSTNNLSEFAKEFVSMHIGSSNAMNSDGEIAFNQLIQNMIGVMILGMAMGSILYVVDRTLQYIMAAQFKLPLIKKY